ncbi:MAG: carbamoyltransferase [Candidatus Hydrogenedentota bacterium]|nr:MAG: carbamoyltransferase [Candidatus Hydrogenedentota bacterium]
MRAILGIQEAHDASAALMVDGRIVAAAQEERFSGLKGDYGFPRQAVAYCLREAGIDSSDLDEVALASHSWNPVLTKIKRNANFSVEDWVKEQHDYWYPTKYEKKNVVYYDLWKDRKDFRFDDFYPMEGILQGYMDPVEMEKMKELRLQTVADYLRLPRERVRTVTHEDCHRFYAYFGSPLRGEVLSLTSEGIGDYSNGTVGIFSEKGFRELAHTKDNHIGHIYQYVTLLLGMKPAQHEYKVMGLAPYANARELERSYRVFERVLKVDGLKIVFDQEPPDLYFHFRKALEGHRFDGIAGAAQKMVEELLCAWVRNCIAETGLHRVIFSGGVAQNIKADMKIAQMDEVEDIFVCPAAGDTSLPLGACYLAMWEFLKKEGLSADRLLPLDTAYLGPQFTDEETRRVIEETKAAERYDVREHVAPAEVARLLAEGKIIARCAGRMEFGLRALGNRSILADPRHPQTVRKINEAIKFRDFWMPFTPSILAERESEYIVNPKGLKAPFMTMAFDSTARARRELPAALHPADETARPQSLEKRHNPIYHAIISEFEKITGVGGILNTSFNLHGYPIVLGPKEALFTLDNSELDGVLLGDILVSRRAPMS